MQIKEQIGMNDLTHNLTKKLDMLVLKEIKDLLVVKHYN